MKTVRFAFKTSCVLAAAMCASVLASRSAMAQVLDQVPSDALAVVKVNHIAETNTKLSNLMQKLGVSDVFPPAKDPVEAIETQLGLGAGLDNKRDAAAVLLNGKFDDGPAPPPMLILLPVSDYQAFLGSVTVVRTEGDVSVVHFKDNDQDTFVENWGGYAAISPTKEDVTGKHDGLKPTGSAAKELDSQDICVYVNFPALKTVLLPKLEEGQQKAMEALEKNAKQMDAPTKKLAQVALDQVMNGAKEFLNDCQSTTMGLSIGENGIAGNIVVDFVPDTYLGNLAGSIKSTDAPLLGGLPKATYLLYGGSIQDPKVAGKLFDDAVAPIVKQLAEMGDDGKKLSTIVDMYKEAMVSTESTSGGLLAPTAALGQGSLLKFVAVVKGDAAKIKAVQSHGAEVQADVMKMFGTPGSDLTKITVTPDFKTIDGVKFDRVLTEVNPDNTSQEAMRAAEMMNRIYGPDGMSVISGVVDPKTMITGMGLDDDFIGQVIEAAKTDKDVLTDDVKSVDADLPKTRSLVYYVAVDQMIQTGLSYARANGMAIPVQLPNNLPPIGFNAGAEGTALRFNMFVPNKLTQGLVQAGIAAYQQFAGHGNNGGGL
jgi:hypothetical protein